MSDRTEKTYAIEGMTCEHCERSVTEEVEELAGVEWARADRAAGRLVVHGESIEDIAIRRAVEAAGYAVAEIAPEACSRMEGERRGEVAR
ncbi:MAG: heavy-metal-associated domain-containing protein [Actinobacteria bacterium]|nr:heavy-metal-associated domain-containing protein [Actinomycetota bacterium]